MKRTTALKLMSAVLSPLILPSLGHALAPDQVFDKVKDSIVVVKTLDAQGRMKGQGSGVLLPSGRIATNCHVVESGSSYRVIQGTQVTPATLYGADSKKDICLLDVKNFTGKPAQLGATKSLKVGVKVYAVGAPQGLELSLSDGIVAQLRGGPPPLIQTTAAISPGSSGGGLFDDEGRLIGLTTLYLKGGQNLNFAMPVEWINSVTPGGANGAPGQNQKKIASEPIQNDWLQRALVLEKSKDWQGLLAWSEKWIKNEPKNGMAWLSLGSAYLEIGRSNEAVNALRQSLRINPNVAEAWSRLATVYVKMSRYNDAADAYRQSLRLNPNSADIWAKLGAANIRLSRYKEAVEACKQGIRIDPKRVSTWALLGNSYTRLKRYDEAIHAYRQALQIDPAFVNGWAGLAVTYHESGNHAAALETIEELRRLDPRLAEELFNMIEPR